VFAGIVDDLLERCFTRFPTAEGHIDDKKQFGRLKEKSVPLRKNLQS
jgi:hypothetical protein